MASGSTTAATVTAVDLSVTVRNVDEDLINLTFATTDGTSSAAPTIKVDLQIDELTAATTVQVLIWKIGEAQTWYTATKLDNLNWQVSETLAEDSISGTYEIRSVRIVRGALAELRLDDTALGNKSFAYQQDIYNTRADSVAPMFSGVNSISVTKNDGDSSTAVTVEIVVSASDAAGGFEKAFSYIEGPGGELSGDWGTLNTDKTKITFTFVLDAKTATGTYKISDIRLYDVAGNQNFVSNSDLVSGSYTDSWSITNPIGDNATPAITAVTLTPQIDTSDLNRKQIKVAVTTDDQVTDINSIYIRIFSPTSESIDEYIVSLGRLGTTTKTDNTYEYIVSLPLEYPDGVYTVSYITVSDKALNEKKYDVSELAGLGLDTVAVFTNSNTPLFDNTTSSFSVSERSTTATTVSATDPTGDTLTYSLTGDDSGLFSISSSGVITFNSATDYESPADGGANNVYQLTVNVTDGTNTNAKTILVTVANVADSAAPAFTSSALSPQTRQHIGRDDRCIGRGWRHIGLQPDGRKRCGQIQHQLKHWRPHLLIRTRLRNTDRYQRGRCIRCNRYLHGQLRKHIPDHRDNGCRR